MTDDIQWDGRQPDLPTPTGRPSDEKAIPHERVTIDGSSSGGFDAIAVAAPIPDAVAVADVPQSDVGTWSPPVDIALTDGVRGHRVVERVHALKARHAAAPALTGSAASGLRRRTSPRPWTSRAGRR